MARQMTRPVIDIKRVPAGEQELESVMADVFLWVFSKYPNPKSSLNEAHTFGESELAEYNLGTTASQEVKKDGTAA